jgi:hypothetical protein
MSGRATLADLPLYADDMAIGAAVLGPKRALEWKAIAPLLEAKGLPKIDTLHGGRHVPSVAIFYGVPFVTGPTVTGPSTPPALRGVENTEGLWTRNNHRRRA